jgi:peptidoglycan hydrolase CwlO-like protein
MQTNEDRLLRELELAEAESEQLKQRLTNALRMGDEHWANNCKLEDTLAALRAEIAPLKEQIAQLQAIIDKQLY